MIDRSKLRLTSDLVAWEVLLKSGDTIALRAHGVAERDGYLCFVALMAGTPPYEYELVRLPLTSVEDYEGGCPTRRPAAGEREVEGDAS
jgi:hypothetical protein